MLGRRGTADHGVPGGVAISQHLGHLPSDLAVNVLHPAISSGDRRTWREHGDPKTLISAIQRREQHLRASWQEDGADTELLRSAFGRYRAFFDLLTKV